MPPAKRQTPVPDAAPLRTNRRERAAWRDLQRACEANDAAAVAAWCAEGAWVSYSVERRKEYVFEALLQAVKRGQHEVAEVLLKTKPAYGRTLGIIDKMVTANKEGCRMAHLLFRALLQHDDQCCFQCVQYHALAVREWIKLACTCDSIELFAHLLEHHTTDLSHWRIAVRNSVGLKSLGYPEVLARAANFMWGQHRDIIEDLFTFALVRACSANKVELAGFWLDRGARIDGIDETPLIAAAACGHVEVVNFLLERGATVNTLAEILHTPIDREYADVVMRLLNAGARFLDRHFSLAAARGMYEAVDYMLGHGADVHADGNSALLRASRFGHTAIVERLLAAGADVNDRGTHAHPPLDHAAANRRWDTALALVRAGATEVGGVFSMHAPSRTFLWQLAIVFSRAQYDQLLDCDRDLRLLWVFLHVFVLRRLRRFLWRARARLDRPPAAGLHAADPERPTREELVAQMRTAGKRFASEYWAEGLPLFFPGLDLGPVPGEFVF